MINTSTLQMEVKTTINIDVGSITRQLLSANIMRNLYDSRWKNAPLGWGELKVQVGCGRQASHTHTAAKLILDGCEYTDILGNTRIAKGMYVNIDKSRYANLMRDEMSKIEGDWIQRDIEDQPMMIDSFKRESFLGRTFECDFIVIDMGLWGINPSQSRKACDFVDAFMSRYHAGHFPNLKSVLILQ
ncbi:hypothetical protein VPHK469_0190 [Vibrio phage K469]